MAERNKRVFETNEISNVVLIYVKIPSTRLKLSARGGGGGGGGPMTTFGDLGNYVNDFTPSPHDF